MPIDPLNSRNWTTESTVTASSSANSSPSPSGGGYKPPIQQCTCCCNCNDGVEGEIGKSAGGKVLPSVGMQIVSAPELTQHSAGGSGMELGEGLDYSGDGSGAGSGQYADDWVNPHRPMLRFDSGNVFVESGPVETVRYTPDGGGFKPDYFNRDILAYDPATDRYTLTSQKGKRQVFSKGGRLEKVIDAYGNETVLTYALDDTLISMVTGTGADTVGYFYTYTTIAGKKRVTSVVMRVGGPTDASDYRRIVYSFTSAGQLEKVVVDEKEDGDWLEIETAYYRYYSTPGKRLWFVLNDEAYEQMHSVNPSWPEGASDADVSQYADVEYAYQSDGRISEAKTHGGKYTYAFTYAENSPGWAQGPGVWRSKTTVAMPDGSTQTFYFNEALSLLLKKVSEPQPDGSVNVWYPVCQQFDGIMRITLSAPSSAVVSFNESTPTLFNLRPDDGALKIFDYDENGNRSVIALKKGAHGTLVNQQTLTYTGRTVAGDTIYVPETVTEYRDASDSSASNPVTTSYTYTWFAETFQVEKVTTTLPAVPNSENGDDATGTTTTTFDEYGFVVEQVDAVDMKTTYEYDVATGAVKGTVEDAGRLDLTTDYEVDPLGRTVRTLGPVHTISLDGVATEIRRAQWTQYLDSDDEVRTFSGYVKTSDGSEHCVNPIQIARHFVTDPQVSGGRMEESISAVFSGGGIPATATSFPQSDYVRWSTQHFSSNNELTHSRLYHLIPASGLGTSGTNYAQTSFGYDSAGRQNKTTSPEGTISLASYNAMGWGLRSQTGTADANLVSVSTSEYDTNGNVTKTTSMVDGTTANDRISYFRYDWRDRQTETDASDGTILIRTRRTYDNRGNVTQADEYSHSYASASLINRAESFFDGRNRQYRTKRYGVEVGTGTLQPALTSEIYFDQAGRTVRSTPAGKVGFTIVQYDTAGRTRRQFCAWGGTLDLAHPGDISSATVIEQTGLHYDNAGNSTYVSFRQRFDNATGTGSLRNPSNEPKARVSYLATYPDALGRTVDTANYGTNGGTAWTRSAKVPERSDTILVTSSIYNPAGEMEESRNPNPTMTKYEFDQAGRQIKVIENYLGAEIAPDVNKTTRCEYNLDGNITKLIAENPTSGNQVTEWFYGVTIAQGSKLESKSLVYQKEYPNSTGTTDRVTYTYNRQGQVTTLTDQAGTTHTYAFDKAGRVLEDAVTFPSGSILDQTVKRITRSYEVRGMLSKVGSFGTGTTPLNEVLLTYNSYGQLAKDYQEHSGAVEPDTSLFVEYQYETPTLTSNTARRTGITYPDGTTTITTAYLGTDADALSRPDALKEGSDTLCSYRYLGSGVFIGVKYDAASDVELTYQDGGSGDAGDPYTGLDRFGRLIETLWKKGTAAQVHSQYGRNRFGGVVWRKDLTAHTLDITAEDNAYYYDGLYQVKEHQRGNLAGTPPTGITNFQQEEDWTYDATGNWQEYTNSVPDATEVEIGTVASTVGQVISFGHLIGTPPVTAGDLVRVNTSEFTVTQVVINSPQDPVTQDGFYELTVEEDTSGVNDDDAIFAHSVTTSAQTRANNVANEITEIINPGGTLTPTYDSVGNMLTMPTAPSTSTGQYALKWDAWNRLVEVKDGDISVANYRYDGAFRRLSKANASETRQYYYNENWRPVEERVSTFVDRQYTWGLRDRWDLLRCIYSTAGGSSSEAYYCIRDYLDPVAIVGIDGVVKERYTYDAFGKVRFLAPDYSSRSGSSVAWEFLFHNEFCDGDTALYNYGYRHYSICLGRWLSRDPIGNVAGTNLYAFLRNRSMGEIDLFGLADVVIDISIDYNARHFGAPGATSYSNKPNKKADMPTVTGWCECFPRGNWAPRFSVHANMHVQIDTVVAELFPAGWGMGQGVVAALMHEFQHIFYYLAFLELISAMTLEATENSNYENSDLCEKAIEDAIKDFFKTYGRGFPYFQSTQNVHGHWTNVRSHTGWGPINQAPKDPDVLMNDILNYLNTH